MEEKPAGTEGQVAIQPPTEQPETELSTLSLVDKLKTHKFKILGGVLGIFVLAGAVFGAYKLGTRQVQPSPQPSPTPAAVATPTADPTANWQTYTNTKYGYSIKYPSELESKDVDPSTVLGPTGVTAHNFIVWGPTQRPQTEFYDGLSVILGVVTNPEELPLRDFADQASQPTVGERESFEEIQIGDLRGFKAVGVGLGRFTHIFLPYKTADKVIKFTVIWGGEKEEEYRENFNLMLSTFRFLEEEEWQTYTDDVYRYSFEYPPDFLITDYSATERRNIKLSKDNYEVMVRAGKQKENPYFLDQESVGETQMGGLTARLFKFPNGFCEVGTCTSPFVAVVAYKGDYRYVMEFYQTTEITGVYQQILSSFRFLD